MHIPAELVEDLSCRHIPDMELTRDHVNILEVILSRRNVCQRSPSIFRLRSLTLEKQPPGLPPDSKQCACMFLRMLGSLDTGGSNRLGATDTSWYPLSLGHVWTPTVGIAAVDRGACCGPISSQWCRIVCGIGCSVPGSSSVQVDDVTSIECFPLCLMSTLPSDVYSHRFE